MRKFGKQNHRTKRHLKCLGFGCLVFILLVGCGQDPGRQSKLGESTHDNTSNDPNLKQPNTSERPSRERLVSTSAAKRYNAVPQATDSIVVGLDADMSSGSAQSGEAIRRGLELAIAKINRSGGLLGKPLELIVRDHRGNPDRGLGNLEAFNEVPNLLGVFGGIHTPVAVRELEYIHTNRLLYLGPWAAGTSIVENGYSPNYVFRVSVRDEYAGGFLVNQAIQRGFQKIGLLLERTAWGRSNEHAVKTAMARRELAPACVEWFNWGETDLQPQVERLVASGCDVLLLVGNSIEGVAAVNAVASIEQDQRPAVISHWGISGGRFFELAKPQLAEIDLSFLQTFSFVEPRYPERVAELIQEYLNRFEDCDSVEDIDAPVGTAHAYELMQMLSLAVTKAESIQSSEVLKALESIREYRGMIRDYARPFPSDHHDALDASDFVLARFNSDGVIVPVKE